MADNRIIIQLKCDECKNKNYSTTKNKVNTKKKIEIKKYCPACGKHTKHKETKK